MEAKEERKKGYYLINGKRVLYWNGEEWIKAVRDRSGNYGCYIASLEKQPKVIKSIEKYNTIYD